MRSTLLTRLVLASLAVAAAATVATAYITSVTTSDRIERDASRSLDTDIEIRDALIDYAVRSSDWSDVGRLVARLAGSSGRHITLTTIAGVLLADAGPDGATPARSLPERMTRWPDALGDPAALIDPVSTIAGAAALSPVVLGSSGAGPTDGLLVPDVLLADDVAAAEYRSLIGDPLTCLSPGAIGGAWGPVQAPPECTRVDRPPVANRFVEMQADLARRVVECTTGSGAAAWVGYDTHGMARVAVDAAPGATARFRGCASSVRADAFGGAVAPAALLYLAEPAPASNPSWIARAGGTRIVIALATVLAVALLAAFTLAARIVRPLQHLTRASQRLTAGRRDARVDVHGNDELAQLGTAFNEMAGSLAAADNQRRQLVSDVAHELRNPLATINGHLEGAQDGLVPVDAALIESLLDETNHLRRLVDDLQDVALAEAGQLRLAVEPVALDELLSSVVAAAAGTARQRRVELAEQVAPGAFVAGDATRLRQVFANLVDNALRHTPAGGTVLVCAAPGPNGCVRVTVADTGEGIAPEHLAQVFDRFYRTDPARTRDSGGSGLGLAICKHLVEAHGGTITVASRPHHGTDFTVTLPRHTATGEDD